VKTPLQILILLALTAAAATATHYLHPRVPAWYAVETPMRDEDVTWDNVTQRWHKDVLWIDARPKDQYAAAHAPGALSISEQDADAQLADHMEELTTTKKTIVIYCSSDSCEASRKMREYILQRLPVPQIYVFHGGWKVLSKHVEEMKAK
jgi:3-mercaptopyruvate sulfurtransferase SseA